MSSQEITELTKEKLDQIKNEIRPEMIEKLKIIFPDNKIPLNISLISELDSRYTTWQVHCSNPETCLYPDKGDNYCRPNEVGNYQYPEIDEKSGDIDLKDCNTLFNDDILNLIDMNTIIGNNLNNLTLDNSIENDINSIEIKRRFESEIDEYKKLTAELNSQDKIMTNMKNVTAIINKLNNDINKKNQSSENESNILEYSVDTEKYQYIDTQYYIYIILSLAVVITVIMVSMQMDGKQMNRKYVDG